MHRPNPALGLQHHRMLSRLRPELRGARRVLRPIQQQHYTNPRPVIRSFANYSRLSGWFGIGGSSPGSKDGLTEDDETLKQKIEKLRKEIELSQRHSRDLELLVKNHQLIQKGKEFVDSVANGDPRPSDFDPESHRNVQLDSDKPQESKYHGSWRKRRLRRLENQQDKRNAQTQETIPKWFYQSNVVLAKSSQESAQSKTAAKDPESSIAAPSAEEPARDLAQVQLTAAEPAAGQEAQKKRAWGKGREPPPNSSNSKPKPIVPTSYITNTKSLRDGRYHVEASQYDEILNTFKGRLSSSKAAGQDLAVGHMTILHGASDSELLLDALVVDLCDSVGANYIRLDAQDIPELIRKSHAGSDFKDRYTVKTFEAYKELYGKKDNSDPFSSKQEDENDEDDEDEEDEDDESGPQGIDIPLGSFNFGGRDNPFKRLSGLKILGGTGIFAAPSRNEHKYGKIADPAMADTNKSIEEHFASILSAIMSSTDKPEGPSVWQKAKSWSKDKATVDSPSVDVVADSAEGLSEKKPLVIHFQNYKLLQEHGMEGFLDQCVMMANERRQNGQKIMVIGTDSLRSLHDKYNAPRTILDIQERMSYGMSTAVVLTPVFPTRDAEMVLMEDRKNRLRTVNARHLYEMLKTRKHTLHGLEDGFWTSDFKEKIGERDYEALAAQYWPLVQLQRIASIVVGLQSSTPVEDAYQILINSDESKVAWAQRNQPDFAKHENIEKERQKQEGKSKRFRFSTTRHEKKLLSGVIEPEKINTTFDDIHIPAETVEALKMLTTLSLQRPDAFSYGVLKSDRIPGLLLYGPPGTGKTLAAKAVARVSGATMLEVSAADLNDMYVGEGEKNVQALFTLARKLSPCVVFLDEADAMFSARASGKRASHREILNQFLKEWDGMSNDAGSAFLMVATNRPMDLDDAVLRRLPRRLLVDLPTEADRHKILQIHLRHEELEDVDLADLAKKTPFYSGSDLKNVAVAAALNAVREENELAAKFRVEQEQRPEDEQEEFKYPEKRILKGSHFEKALEEIGASISQDMTSLREIKKFDEQYGDKRGRKRKSPKWGFKSASEANKVLDTVKVRN